MNAGEFVRAAGANIRASAGAVLLTLLVAPPATPAVAAEIDWPKVESEATALLQSLIRIDTSNPPGNEIQAARFLKQVFADAGIEAQVYEPEPGRGTVLARVRGSGEAAHRRGQSEHSCLHLAGQAGGVAKLARR